MAVVVSCGEPNVSQEQAPAEAGEEFAVGQDKSAEEKDSPEKETTDSGEVLDTAPTTDQNLDDGILPQELAAESSPQDFFEQDKADAAEPSTLPDNPPNEEHAWEEASEPTQDAPSRDSTPDSSTAADTPTKESPPEPASCLENNDCPPPTCQAVSGGSCKQGLTLCEQGRCKTTTRNVANAQCFTTDGFCRFKQQICQESYDGALLSTAIYPSESISSLPAKFKHEKTIQGTSRDGTMMFFTTDSPQTVCHVVFKGVSPQSVKDLVAALSSVKAVDCKTSAGKLMGKCGTGFYSQYESLRQTGVVGYVRDWVEQWKCPGGLRLYGHSMGGAEAVLLATELYTLDAKTYHKNAMRLYTFGAPRLYQTTPANQFHTDLTAVRWVNDGDAVPTTPPAALNFRHFGASYEITKSGGQTKFSSKGQDYSPTPDLFDLDGSHKYTTYASRLKSCTGL